MISKRELEEYAKIKKLNLGQAEKDYFQQIFLLILYSHLGRELVFKGGTALSKAYGLDRFSEDLDFTLSKEEKIKEILLDGIRRFYLDAEIEEQKFPNSLSFILRLKGPLYSGIRQSLCKIELDFSLRDKVVLEPKLVTIGRLLRELPAFDVVVMAKEEILAEKVRAIMTRTKARDVYDLWFLLQDTEVNFALIEEKLQIMHKKYSFKEFEEHLHMKKEIWGSELTLLIAKVPVFSEVKKFILSRMPK